MSSPDRRSAGLAGRILVAASAVLASALAVGALAATPTTPRPPATQPPSTQPTSTQPAAAQPPVAHLSGRPWVAKMSDLGREATPAEIQAWDIDVRPDFKGLPPGKGSVADGEVIWDEKCASCHGTFGESNEVFTPLVGGTTTEDIERGMVAGLIQGGGRTTLMKVPTVSTLWDYINRAMPWNAPRTLSTDEVYATLAYLLNLGEIVDADFVLSEKNIAEVQARMPNREGMTRRHGLWTVDGRPDVKAVACMKDCRPAPAGSAPRGDRLPDYARDAHGNLADQQRLVGPTRGAVTENGTPPPADFDAMRASALALAMAGSAAGGGAGKTALDGGAVAKAAGCLACHGIDTKGVGPSLRDIAAKYGDRADRVDYLAGKIAEGGQGVWGAIPMPPQAGVAEADRRAIAQWIAEGAK